MKDNSTNKTQTLAKNTILLYIRLILTMLIALFTSRVVLNALGVEDYGLYNVVGGVITMLSIVTSGLTTSTQRYLSYELGRNDESRLRKVFSMCFTTHMILVFLSLGLLETIGLWLVNYSLHIPEGRLVAANIVFQCSVISFVFQVLVVPYTADIISHERMSIYAYIGIFDAVAKLSIAYLISISSIDKLVFYAFLMMIIFVVDFFAYKYICNRDYYETKYQFYYDKSFFKEILFFSSWTMLGQGAMVFCNQGLNILINIFHSVAANAAMGIAQQVNSAISSLTSNFFTAFQPQITKSFSSGDICYVQRLVGLSAKVSFFLILIIALPILLNIHLILELWLGVVPPLTDSFCVVFVLSSVVNSIGTPYWTTVFATGKIKRLQVISTVYYLSCIVVAYFVLKGGCEVVYALLVKLCADILLTILRISETHRMVDDFNIVNTIKTVMIPIAISSVIISIFALYAQTFITNLLSRSLITLVVFCSTFVVFYFIGLVSNERLLVKRLATNIINKKIKHR